MMTPATFRALHRRGDPLVLPNARDLASASWLRAVGRYAARLAGLGVVGVNVEDSDAEGRLVDPELAAHKVHAISTAAPGLYLNARTDPFWVGSPADVRQRTREAVARAHRYLAAGATGVFVPGAIALDVVATLARATRTPNTEAQTRTG
ncbi:isocitrate lyase/phosphoenolpyruvate mutase family protein [Agromyces bauzanensis]|uniref:Uncharacterized protein n=1 Tax=Agromyces bauzanensis TaxID=1308924 RepID=A0A917UN11_9MICO|nr:isocitrate lyase/phosphoenolpyruvate mutase family protein [Agromyces bauzanensis]GGJ69466.1 hypothetical protein GCM10011372_04090 [Agromyces bauzanensis]